MLSKTRWLQFACSLNFLVDVSMMTCKKRSWSFATICVLWRRKPFDHDVLKTRQCLLLGHPIHTNDGEHSQLNFKHWPGLPKISNIYALNKRVRDLWQKNGPLEEARSFNAKNDLLFHDPKMPMGRQTELVRFLWFVLVGSSKINFGFHYAFLAVYVATAKAYNRICWFLRRILFSK